jgi:hypothetical protein
MTPGSETLHEMVLLMGVAGKPVGFLDNENVHE